MWKKHLSTSPLLITPSLYTHICIGNCSDMRCGSLHDREFTAHLSQTQLSLCNRQKSDAEPYKCQKETSFSHTPISVILECWFTTGQHLLLHPSNPLQLTGISIPLQSFVPFFDGNDRNVWIKKFKFHTPAQWKHSQTPMMDWQYGMSLWTNMCSEDRNVIVDLCSMFLSNTFRNPHDVTAFLLLQFKVWVEHTKMELLEESMDIQPNLQLTNTF